MNFSKFTVTRWAVLAAFIGLLGYGLWTLPGSKRSAPPPAVAPPVQVAPQQKGTPPAAQVKQKVAPKKVTRAPEAKAPNPCRHVPRAAYTNPKETVIAVAQARGVTGKNLERLKQCIGAS